MYNWLNATSRTQGLIMGRWQGLPTNSNDIDSGIEVVSSVVKLDDLRDVLPEETEYVTTEQHKQQLQDQKGVQSHPFPIVNIYI